jgi:predicted nucleic acid-binding protein
VADRVLVDTSALLALVHPRDQSHRRALDVGRRYVAAGGRFVGTTLILAELQGHMLNRRGPAEARALLATLLEDRLYHWVDVSAVLVRSALDAWLERFADQRFTLCDAVSFEVMRKENLTTAFAFDGDFVTAGFTLLR